MLAFTKIDIHNLQELQSNMDLSTAPFETVYENYTSTLIVLFRVCYQR